MPNSTELKDWASCLTINDEGTVFKVMASNSDYYGAIFIIKDTILKFIESGEDLDPCVKFEYEIDQSPGSKIHQYGMYGFEEELKLWVLELIRLEEMNDSTD